MSEEHSVYCTTNIVNGKFYIGKHSSSNANDGYLGSGEILKRAIKKYGRENFTKDIIGTFQDEEQAYRYERLIVGHYIKDRLCYNIAEGGRGITSEARKKNWEKEEYRQKMSEAARKRMEDPKFKQKMIEAMRKPERRQKISEEIKKKWKDPKFKQKHNEAMRKPECRQKMSEATRGENNPNAKLKENDVKDIKRRLMNGESVTNIAKAYNVSYNIIRKIKNGKTWLHVQIN
jgi:group I intron endonuclease